MNTFGCYNFIFYNPLSHSPFLTILSPILCPFRDAALHSSAHAFGYVTLSEPQTGAKFIGQAHNGSSSLIFPLLISEIIIEMIKIATKMNLVFCIMMKRFLMLINRLNQRLKIFDKNWKYLKRV